MIDMEKNRIVRKGYWKYDGLIDKGVFITAINYDFWYELEKEEGLDMSDETPTLNENGEMYMIYWMDKDFIELQGSSVGKLELMPTIELAESIVQQKIKWVSELDKIPPVEGS